MTPSGLLILNKPVGPTSHDVVEQVRRATGARKVGHVGTLDPLAAGVLLVLVGNITRLSEYLVGHDKRYRAIVRFGRATDTYDAGGRMTRQAPVTFTESRLRAVLENLRGRQHQVPPSYSAVKVRGRKAYEMARAGEEVQLESRVIEVYALNLLRWTPPEAVLEIHCSSGTYVRTMAHELGMTLGAYAHLAGLTRTCIGHFCVDQAIDLEELQEACRQGTWQKYLIPASEALPELPLVRFSLEDAQWLQQGGRVKAAEGPSGLCRAVDDQGNLVAVVEWLADFQAWQPKKVFPRDS